MSNEELDDILNDRWEKWIKIKRYKDCEHEITAEYNCLLAHHEEETAFLIAKCKELAHSIIHLKLEQQHEREYNRRYE